MERIRLHNTVDESKLIHRIWKTYIAAVGFILAEAAIVLAFIGGLVYMLTALKGIDSFYLYIMAVGFVLIQAVLLLGSRIAATYAAQMARNILGDKGALLLDRDGIERHGVSEEIQRFSWNDVSLFKKNKGFYMIMLRQYPCLRFSTEGMGERELSELDELCGEKQLYQTRMLEPSNVEPLPDEEYSNAVARFTFLRTAKDMYRFNTYYLFSCMNILTYDFILLLVGGLAVYLLRRAEVDYSLPLIITIMLLVALNTVVIVISRSNSRRNGTETNEITLYEDRIMSRDFLGRAEQYWQRLVAVRITRKYYYCFLTPQAALVIPKREMSEEARELMDEKIFVYKLDERKLKLSEAAQ